MFADTSKPLFELLIGWRLRCTLFVLCCVRLLSSIFFSSIEVMRLCVLGGRWCLVCSSLNYKLQDVMFLWMNIRRTAYIRSLASHLHHFTVLPLSLCYFVSLDWYLVPRHTFVVLTASLLSLICLSFTWVFLILECKTKREEYDGETRITFGASTIVQVKQIRVFFLFALTKCHTLFAVRFSFRFANRTALDISVGLDGSMSSFVCIQFFTPWLRQYFAILTLFPRPSRFASRGCSKGTSRM